jgi:hypothetical protein
MYEAGRPLIKLKRIALPIILIGVGQGAAFGPTHPRRRRQYRTATLEPPQVLSTSPTSSATWPI